MNKDLKTFSTVFVMIGILSFVMHSLHFYIPIYLKDIGLTGFQIGILFSLFSIAALITIFEAGIFADRFTSRHMIIVGLIIMGASYVVFSFTKSFWLLILLFFLIGIAKNTNGIAFDSFTLKKVHKKKKGKEFGWYAMAKSLPGVAGYIVGGLLLTIISFKMFILLVGIILLGLIFLTHLIPKTKKTKEKISTYLQDFKKPRVWIFLSFIFLFTLHWGVENVAYGLYLKEHLFLSFTQMGFFIGIPIIFLSLTTLFVGKKYNKGLKMYKILIAAFLLSGIGFLGMGLTSNPIIAFIARIIHEIGDGTFVIFIFAGAAYNFGKKRIGGDFGLVILATILAAFIGALIFSPLGEAFGYNIPHTISGIIMILTAMGFFFYHKHHHK